MRLKIFYNLIFLLFLCSGFSCSAQRTPPFGKGYKKTLREVALEHKQIYSFSCIPMSIEMILKFNNRVAPDYYDLQKDWKDKNDGTFRNFDGRTISGIKFKHQFNINRGDDFPFDSLFKTIDAELAAGRKVIVSLPSGRDLWHMFVIDSKMGGDDYLAFSRYYNDNNLIAKEHVKRAIRACKGTDILTYQVVN